MVLSGNLIGGFRWQPFPRIAKVSAVAGTQKIGVHCMVPGGLDGEIEVNAYFTKKKCFFLV